MFVGLDTAKERYQTCKSCEKFQAIIKTCGICNCFMPGKVILSSSVCPDKKWVASETSGSKIDYSIKDYE